MQRLIPLVLSAVAVALASYAALREPAAPAAPCACDDRATRAEVARLRSELQFVASALARSTRGTQVVNAPASDGAAQPAIAEHAPAEVTRVEAPPGITVKLDEAGVPAVHNRDPGLVGQTIIVQVHRADGTLEPMPVTVPPVAP